MTLLLLSNDANRAGAQLVLLHLMRLLKEEGVQMRLLLGEGGSLLDEYRALCPVTIWTTPSPFVTNAVGDKVLGKLGLWHQLNERKSAQQQRIVQQQLDLDSVDLVLVNTVTSSRWFRELAIPAHIPVVTFVHELAMSVRIYTRPDDLTYLLQRTTHLLAVSDTTARYYEQHWGFDPARITRFTLIDTPAMERAVGLASQQPNIYAELGLPNDALIVGGCGNAEWRKGNDLFIAIARQVIGRSADQPGAAQPGAARPIHFVWVGVPAGTLRDDLELDVQKAGLAGRVHLISPTPDVLRYMSRFDVFVLCSREDPYPLVVFEAGLSGVPVVCFADAGGSPELVESDGGAVVPYLDLDTMSSEILDLLQQPQKRQAMGQRLGAKIRERHAARQSVDTLLSLFAQLTP
ncbi:glycosyltransferase family 4 protein [Spirosoma sp. KUDC1026]|uniref:glycosyltransferase family 4 protein n=1 Tax=Spirosoma sp. KUDC1026 TaxID=2745947 RepID=UPI00159B9006|nr:glycosyltransferase family 4 protein [Spirosoma sp. KUDC1026]QKZ13646.1 glycosyltransferase family 4 protein [Spirosoma sp. KUDC1026]